MKLPLRAACLAAATFAVTAIPALAVTQHAGSYTFRTDFTDASGFGSGAIEGVLNIRIASDGTVQGLYREVDQSRERIVTGGLTGTQLWLQIGDDHIDATFSGGKIDGYTQGYARSFGGGFDDGYGLEFKAEPVTPQL